MDSAEPPLFSVIIPTRNRSSLFAVALQSVCDQRFSNFEIIVVDVGSSPEHAERTRTLVEAAAGSARGVSLVRTECLQGPSYSRNFGVEYAHGDYLCFLDDDDQWTDPAYLHRVARVIATGPEAVDLIFANQRAYRDGVPQAGVTWIEDLTERLRGQPDAAGSHRVTPKELLACPAHCHLNTTTVRRQFFDDLGGFDQSIRYEEDRDLFLRAIDRASLIKYLPVTVSRHNVPDPAARASGSTSISEMSKRLDQLRLLDKAALLSVRAELRRYALRERAYVLQHIAAEAVRLGRSDCAGHYAREALVSRLAMRWPPARALAALRRRFSAFIFEK